MNPCYNWKLCCNPLKIFIELVDFQNKLSYPFRKRIGPNRKSTNQKEVDNKIHTASMTRIGMPSRTLIDLQFKPKVGHVRRLHVKFQLDPTIGLRIMIVVVKLDSCTFYVKSKFDLSWIVSLPMWNLIYKCNHDEDHGKNEFRDGKHV
jgi:hypothetical protein